MPDIFTAPAPAVAPVTPAPVTAPVVDPASQTPAPGSAVDQLVGAGKKFATLEDLANGKLHSDGHIETLTAELASLRTDLEGRASATEILAQLKEVQLKPEVPVAPTPAAMDEGKITDLVKSTMTDLDVEGKKTANRLLVSDRLAKEWGGTEASQALLASKAAGLGVTVPFLQGVVETSPNAFYQLVGLTGQPADRVAPGPGDVVNKAVVNDPATGPDGQGGLTENDWGWWQNLRRTNPTKYHSGPMSARKNALVTAGTLVLPTR